MVSFGFFKIPKLSRSRMHDDNGLSELNNFVRVDNCDTSARNGLKEISVVRRKNTDVLLK